jgi:LysM repeat protein
MRILRLAPRPLMVMSLGVLLALLVSGCGLLSDSKGDSSGNASGVTIVQALLGTGLNDQQQLTGLVARAFPPDTDHIYAVMILQGVDVGAEVTGRWYQLSTQDAPPEGSFVSEAGVTLTEDNISQDGAARVALDLASNSGALPLGDWVLRVYVDGAFVRTMGFVITSQLGAGAGQQVQPSPTAVPQEQPTQAPQEQPTVAPTTAPQTYTVQSGDTLTTIAERFKPSGESTDSYVTRIVAQNKLAPGSILFVGQVLELPGPAAP